LSSQNLVMSPQCTFHWICSFILIDSSIWLSCLRSFHQWECKLIFLPSSKFLYPPYIFLSTALLYIYFVTATAQPSNVVGKNIHLCVFLSPNSIASFLSLASISAKLWIKHKWHVYASKPMVVPKSHNCWASSNSWLLQTILLLNLPSASNFFLSAKVIYILIGVPEVLNSA